MTCVIISGGIDPSVGSMAALISGVMIMVMNAALESFGATWGVVLIGMAASLALGMLAGLVQGLIITRGRIEAFIVTLGILGVYRCVVTFLANGGPLSLDLALRSVHRPVYYGTFLSEIGR